LSACDCDSFVRLSQTGQSAADIGNTLAEENVLGMSAE